MDSDAASGVISPLPHNDRELIEVSHYVANYERQMQNLSDDFNKKNYLQLIWDSKVPDEDKRWYYFFSLSASDRDDVVGGIKKYENFYKEMGDAIQKVKQSEEEGDNSEVNPFFIICELNNTLKEMYNAAKEKERSASSSTLYNLHKSFQRQHAQLEHAIKRVECVALKSAVAKAREASESARREVGTLKNEMHEITRNNEKMCEKFDKLTIENEEMKNNMDKLLQANEKMTQQIETLLRIIMEQQKS